MSAKVRILEGRVRGAAALVGAGLIVELGSLYWNDALSFIVFSGAGALLAGAGIALYLYAVATRA